MPTLTGDPDHNFAANVKAARERRGWSQAEFSRRVNDAGLDNFHQTTVSRVEKGERVVRLGEAQAIARLLETTVDDLISPPAHFLDRQDILGRLSDYIGYREYGLRPALLEFVRIRSQLGEAVGHLTLEGVAEEDWDENVDLHFAKEITRAHLQELSVGQLLGLARAFLDFRVLDDVNGILDED